MTAYLIELEHEGHRYPVGVSEADLTPTIVRLQQDEVVTPEAELHSVPLPVDTSLVQGKVNSVTLQDVVLQQLALLRYQKRTKRARFWVINIGRRAIMRTVFVADSVEDTAKVVDSVYDRLRGTALSSLPLGGGDGLTALFLSEGPVTDFPNALDEVGVDGLARELIKAVEG